MVAVSRVIEPKDSFSKVLTWQVGSQPARQIWEGPLYTVSGEIPCSRAAIKTNGFIAEPGCRRPWVARLNFSVPLSRPATIEVTYPVWGSTETTAA